MGINFSGISSGIDTGAIVEAFVNSERSSIRAMESQKSDYNAELQSVQDLNSKLQKLQTSMQGMADIGDFLEYSATYAGNTTDNQVLDVTATGEATPGVYDVKVVQLAQTEREYSKAFTDKTLAGAAGDGTFSITVGTGASAVTTDLTIDPTDTLEDIVNKINASDANVNASILFTGSEYKVQITATESGSANSISFAQTGTLDLQMTQYKAAQDAIVEVDGNQITSDTNSFADAMPGVTFTAKQVTATAQTLEVAADTEGIEGNLQSFIDEYNDIISQTRSDTHASSTMRSLQMQLGMMVADEVGDVGGAFTALSQIGISTGNDGKLSLDSDDLKDALARDTRGVAKLFSGSDDGTVVGMADLMDTFIEGYVKSVDGVLASQQSGLERMISSIDTSIAQEEDRIDKYEEGLVAQFTQMELQMNQLQSQQSYLSSMAL